MGPISSSSWLLSLKQKSTVRKDKSWPLREQLKKASKNTQQALARSSHLPSLKLTAKESPGGRKFGLCPTCKCAVWGAVGERATRKHCGFRGSQYTHLRHPRALWKGRSTTVIYWAWLCHQVSGEKFIAGDLKQICHCCCQSAVGHTLSSEHKGLVYVRKTSYLKTSQEFKNTNVTQDIAVGDITNVTLQTVLLLSYLRELLLALPRCADHRDFQKKNEMSSQHPFSLWQKGWLLYTSIMA